MVSSTLIIRPAISGGKSTLGGVNLQEENRWPFHDGWWMIRIAICVILSFNTLLYNPNWILWRDVIFSIFVAKHLFIANSNLEILVHQPKLSCLFDDFVKWTNVACQHFFSPYNRSAASATFFSPYPLWSFVVTACSGMQRSKGTPVTTSLFGEEIMRNHKTSRRGLCLQLMKNNWLTLPEINRNIAFENSPFTQKRKIHLNQPLIFRDKLLVSGMVVLMVEYSQQALPLFQSVRIFEKSHIKEKTHVYLVPKLYPWDDCIFAYMQTINISHSCG